MIDFFKRILFFLIIKPSRKPENATKYKIKWASKSFPSSGPCQYLSGGPPACAHIQAVHSKTVGDTLPVGSASARWPQFKCLG